MSFGPHRRPLRWVLAGAVVIMTAAIGLSMLGSARPPLLTAVPATEAGSVPAVEGAPPSTGPGADGSDQVDVATADDGHQAPLPAAVGRVDDLILLSPAHRVVLAGFHEASSAAFAIEPIGQLLSNENTTRFTAIADRDGTPYHVLSSRGRIHPPTSALDVVMEDGEPVLAPVSGVVADVRAYDLYDQHPDHRIEIHPTGAPHLRVVLVHVAEVRVREGDTVEAGVTVVAGTAQRFPFRSQIDRETEPDRWPHVHLEVQPIDAPRPGDEPDDEALDDGADDDVAPVDPSDG